MSDNFSFISHVAQLYDVSEVLSEERIAYFAACNCPSHLDKDRAIKAALFIYKYGMLFDAAISDVVALNISNYQLDKLIALLDKLFIVYASGEAIDEMLLRVRRLLNRYYADKLPIWYCWYLIRSQLLYTYPDQSFLPGMPDSSIEAAIEKRHAKLIENKEKNDMNDDPRIGDCVVRVNKLEKAVNVLTSGVADLQKMLASVQQMLQNQQAQANQVTAPATQAIVAPTTGQAPNTPQVQITSQAAQTSAAPITISKPKTRQEREVEEYEKAVADFKNKYFSNGKFDILGAISCVKATIEAGGVDTEKLMQQAINAYCKKDPQADMAQIFRLIFSVKSQASVVDTAVKQIAADGKILDLYGTVQAYVRKDRAGAFNGSKQFREHQNPAVQKVGMLLMGW